MNVLVTGGAGFLGTHLLEYIRGLSYISLVKVVDITEPRVRGFKEYRFYQGCLSDILHSRVDLLHDIDVVFHLAWSSIPETSVNNPIRDIEANLVDSVRLFEKCVEENVGKVVFMSSGGAVYGETRTLVVSEEASTDPISPYGISKLMTEKYLSLLHRLRGLNYAILRPSLPYGEYQNPFGRQGAIAVFLGKIFCGDPLTIWGDPDSIVRDFFHAHDLARACLLAANIDLPVGVYNLGGGTAVSLSELIDMMRRVVGSNYRISVQTNPGRPFDVHRLVLDIKKSREILRWEPTIGLEDGLLKTWKWVKEHKNYEGMVV